MAEASVQDEAPEATTEETEELTDRDVLVELAILAMDSDLPQVLTRLEELGREDVIAAAEDLRAVLEELSDDEPEEPEAEATEEVSPG